MATPKKIKARNAFFLARKIYKNGLDAVCKEIGFNPIANIIQHRLELQSLIDELEDNERIGWNRSTKDEIEIKSMLLEAKKDAAELDEVLLPYFYPKQVAAKGTIGHTHEHKHTVEGISETFAWIEEELGIAEDSEDKGSLPN